jgi:hypothetical protein
MKTEYKLALLGLLLVAGLEVFALAQGIDGTMFAASVGGIGTIVGYVLRGAKKS